MPGPITDGLAWLTIGLLATGTVIERFDRSLGRYVFSAAWIVFGAFWVLLGIHYIELGSFITAGGCLLAVSLSIYVAYLLYAGREPLSVLSRAVAVMGLIYLPFAAIHPLREFLVELVSRQLYFALTTLGYHPELTIAEINGFQSAFVFSDGAGQKYSMTIVFVCTGIESISIMSGLVTVAKAPTRRKIRTLAIVIPAIWILNFIRTVFVAFGYGKQWFQIFVDPVMGVVGYTDPHHVSFFWADRVISQSLTIGALVLLIWVVSREFPEFVSVVKGILSEFTDIRYDFQALIS